jgi:hypothetical protein
VGHLGRICFGHLSITICTCTSAAAALFGGSSLCPFLGGSNTHLARPSYSRRVAICKSGLENGAARMIASMRRGFVVLVVCCVLPPTAAGEALSSSLLV